MDKKPSFLERLTGAMGEEIDEDIELKKNDRSDDDDNESDEEEQAEEKSVKKSESKFKKSKTISLPQGADDDLADKDDWLPDTEGQLTIDVYQTPLEIVIKSTIAGVDPANLDITVTNDMVTVKGKREKDETISTGDYYYQECYWGAFSRSVILPVDVEAEKAEASMKNGILTIRLPKIEKVKTKKIKVISK